MIPNGIDPHEIGAADPAPRPAATFMPQGTLRLLYVGSLWTLKRVDVLLRAVAAINAPGEGAWDGDAAPFRVTLTLVGAGPARQSLEHLTAELGLIDQVIFVGQAQRHAMACHYQGGRFAVPAFGLRCLAHRRARSHGLRLAGGGERNGGHPLSG